MTKHKNDIYEDDLWLRTRGANEAGERADANIVALEIYKTQSNQTYMP